MSPNQGSPADKMGRVYNKNGVFLVDLVEIVFFLKAVTN